MRFDNNFKIHIGSSIITDLYAETTVIADHLPQRHRETAPLSLEDIELLASSSLVKDANNYYATLQIPKHAPISEIQR